MRSIAACGGYVSKALSVAAAISGEKPVRELACINLTAADAMRALAEGDHERSSELSRTINEAVTRLGAQLAEVGTVTLIR